MQGHVLCRALHFKLSDNFLRQVRIDDFQFNTVTFSSPSCLLNNMYSSEICDETVPIQILIYKNDTSLRILTICLNLDVQSTSVFKNIPKFKHDLLKLKYGFKVFPWLPLHVDISVCDCL